MERVARLQYLIYLAAIAVVAVGLLGGALTSSEEGPQDQTAASLQGVERALDRLGAGLVGVARPLVMRTPVASTQTAILPDRAVCSEIAGTDYRSAFERAWYLDNCLQPVEAPAPATAEPRPPLIVFVPVQAQLQAASTCSVAAATNSACAATQATPAPSPTATRQTQKSNASSPRATPTPLPRRPVRDEREAD